MSETHEKQDTQETVSRRGFLSTLAMTGGLVASLGTLGGMGVKFLTPREQSGKTVELFIGKADAIPVNSSTIVHDLKGGEIIVLRTRDGFKGFSNVCPHLGCHVHWEPGENIFYCPCHEGKFDTGGAAVAGPPKDAKQKLSLARIRHDAKSGNLFLVSPTA